MRNKMIPEWLLEVDLIGDPGVLIRDVAGIAIMPGEHAEKAAKIGDRVDEALNLKGVVGSRLERRDDELIERIALLMMGSAEEGGQHAIDALIVWLTSKGMDAKVLQQIREFAQSEISGSAE